MQPHGLILPTHTPELFAAAVERAATLLRAGEVVAVPTETVYGLAANARNERAVQRIFAIKGRPASNPLIVHVANLAMAQRCVRSWPESAQKLAGAFWPGPLTLVLPKTAEIPDAVTAGGPTVAVRWPSHPFMQALITACAFPLAAPSANRSNELSPTTAEHVQRTLGAQVPLIVDGGSSQVGIESTVLDLTGAPPRLLRPGMIHVESLMAVVGPVEERGPEAAGPQRSPGLMPKHYAPRARLRVSRWRSDEELAAQLKALGADPERIHVIAHTRAPLHLDRVRVCIIPHDAEAFARAMYAELHRCDEAGAEWIVVEEPPDLPEWQGISDRLRRAAT